MICVNKRAKSVLDKLTQGLDEPGDNRVIDNAPGAFMSVHVEHIGDCDLGPMFSVAHYYEQNGNGQIDGVNRKLQRDLANFTGERMNNIRQQQGL